MASDKLNIAIVGAGITGLSAGYILSKYHRVVVYEQNNYLGGNARTISTKIQDDNFYIDTGFNSFNKKNYPNFLKFIEHINAPIKSHKFSFSSSFEQEKFEFSTKNISSLFKKTDIVLEREMYKMKQDLDRFVNLILKYKKKSNTTIEEFLKSAQFGKYFVKYYFMPLVDFVCHNADIHSVKIYNVLTELENIGLLQTDELFYTIDGGIIEFIKILEQNIKNIRINCKIVNIQRMRKKISIEDTMGVNNFDKVIFASHPKEFMQVVQDIEDEEYGILNIFKQKDIHTVLHSSADFMPIDRKNWSMYNRKANTYENDKPLGNSIWINPIAGKDTRYPIILTTDYSKKPDFLYDEYIFKQPIFTANTQRYQDRVTDIQGHNNCFYCGSYLKSGNLEGAVTSAIEICNRLNIRAPWNQKS